MRLSIFLALLLLYNPTKAQQRKLIQFGTVTSQEMKMTAYEKDSTAAAVVLYDKGYFNGDRFDFTRHVRIKILSSAGTSFANFTIRAPSKAFIDGYTFNMEGALLQKTKLENSNIYNEEIVDGFDVYKVFFPNVKPGSVIDFRYTHQGLPLEWRFQDVIPVQYSELTLEPTTNVYYKKIFYGFEKISEPKKDEFIAENMPAIKLEPMMDHYSNYVTRFQFDIESIAYPRWNYYRDFSTKWEKVGERLMELEFFGGVINGSSFLNDRAKEIKLANGSVEEKMKSSVDYIRDNIKWNHDFSLIASKSFREDFKTRHSGSSATVNLLLIALLKKVGLDVFPVVLSTRENGMINPLSASMNKLNYVVALVKDADRSWLVDATTTHITPGLLPQHCLNQTGWIIQEGESGQLIDLTPDRAGVVKRFIMIKPNERNELTAEITNTYEGYAYLNWLEEFERRGSERSYGDYLTSQHADGQIDDYALLQQDNGGLKGSERFTVPLLGSAYFQQISNSEIAVNPLIFNDFINPFKSTERKFPIDFIYPSKRSTTVSMEVPVGFTLKSLPESSIITYPDDKVKFRFLSSVSNNIVNIRYDFSINKPVFTEDEYTTVKTFFTEVLRKLNEPVQITKK